MRALREEATCLIRGMHAASTLGRAAMRGYNAHFEGAAELAKLAVLLLGEVDVCPERLADAPAVRHGHDPRQRQRERAHQASGHRRKQ
jgi:hypothetical protein